MSEVTVGQPVEPEASMGRSLPEELDRAASPIWVALLALIAAPLTLIIATAGQSNTLGLLFMYAGCVGVFVGIRDVYRRVMEWRETVKAFVMDRNTATTAINAVTAFTHERWASRPLAVVFAASFAVIALAVFLYGGLFDNLPRWGVYVSILFVSVASYVCALGLCAVWRLTLLMRMLGKYDVVVTPHQFGVLSVGRLLGFAFCEAGVVWCLYTATATSCLVSGIVPSIVLAVPALGFFVIGFVAAQLPLHDRMLAFKRGAVWEVEIELTLIVGAKSPLTEDSRKQVEFLERRLASLLALPEWPFRWPSVVAVIVSSSASIAAPLCKAGLAEVMKLIH